MVGLAHSLQLLGLYAVCVGPHRLHQAALLRDGQQVRGRASGRGPTRIVRGFPRSAGLRLRLRLFSVRAAKSMGVGSALCGGCFAAYCVCGLGFMRRARGRIHGRGSCMGFGLFLFVWMCFCGVLYNHCLSSAGTVTIDHHFSTVSAKMLGNSKK